MPWAGLAKPGQSKFQACFIQYFKKYLSAQLGDIYIKKDLKSSLGNLCFTNADQIVTRSIQPFIGYSTLSYSPLPAVWLIYPSLLREQAESHKLNDAVGLTTNAAWQTSLLWIL